MNKFEQLKARYTQGFITDGQLERYHKLGVLTDEQYKEIYEIKHPLVVEVEPEEEETEAEEPTEPTEGEVESTEVEPAVE